MDYGLYFIITKYNIASKNCESPCCTSETYVILYSNYGGLVTKLCLILGTPWTVTPQVLLAMGFPQQEYWSALHFLL